MSQDTASTQVQVEEDDRKVFVGNLAFKTTEAELAEYFSKPNPVVRADIITRTFRTSGTVRSLGFGFVVYETVAHAEHAAATYNKTELGGRQINVEVSKPRGERPPRPPRTFKPRKEEKDEKKDDTSAEADADADTDAAEIKPRTGRGNRSARGGKRNKPRKEGEEAKSESATDSWGTPGDNPAKDWVDSERKLADGWSAPTNTGDIWDDNAAPSEGRPKNEGGRGRGARRGPKRGAKKEGQDDKGAQESSSRQDEGANQESSSSRQEDGANGERSGRGRGSRRARGRFGGGSNGRNPKGPFSKTTVRVLNLPYSMDDDGLKGLFADYKVVSANVILKSGQSVGWGHVELADEEEQQKVLELKDLLADGRALTLIAAPEKRKPAEKETGGEASA
ncbi:hypothetical protein BGX34_001721 [Mortierella sp. NVP85]|nr:hypothetical protein BGX34_001721 [Mortierella sp. NVP85]